MNVTNVNIDAVHESLELQISKGRTAVEAAGEARWLTMAKQEMGVLSRQTRDETLEIVDEWLAARLSPPSEDVGILVAKSYAYFLKERVRFGPGDDPVGMLEEAWREWRTATSQ